MKTFHCTHCQNLVFFENVRCLNCGHALAFLPDLGMMAALSESRDGLWRVGAGCARLARLPLVRELRSSQRVQLGGSGRRPRRLLRLVPAESRHSRSCRPSAIASPGFGWRSPNGACSTPCSACGCRLMPKGAAEGSGLAFEFFEDSSDGDAKRVLTGHDNGLITLNIAEADDVHREKERTLQNEPYRTLLGHFRHEIGTLLLGSADFERSASSTPSAQLFGDERADYQKALERHYSDGPPARWEHDFISAYATMHPWEDWAESWAHYLHMVDALETAGATGLALRPKRSDEPRMQPPPDPLNPQYRDFDSMIESWLSLTYVLNNSEPRPGTSRQLSVRFVRPRDRQASLHSRHDRRASGWPRPIRVECRPITSGRFKCRCTSRSITSCITATIGRSRLGPQIIRLRPAPHCRTRILSYSLKITPAEHFINWQQDPQSNYLARVVFPETDPGAAHRSRSGRRDGGAESLRFLPGTLRATIPLPLRGDRGARAGAVSRQPRPATPLFAGISRSISREPRATIDFLVALNQRLAADVQYLIRLEPGVQPPEETLRETLRFLPRFGRAAGADCCAIWDSPRASSPAI